MKIKIIAPVSSLSKRTRLFKLTNYLLEKKYQITHCAWERVEGEAKEVFFDKSDICKKILVQGGGYGGVKTRLLYFWWMIRVFFHCLLQPKNQLIWALGFESAFPALLASKLRGFTVIFDDADRFSLLFPLPQNIKKIIQRLEQWTSRHVALHIIPSLNRYDFSSNSFFILKNTPSKSELQQAKFIYDSKTWPTAKLVVNVNGWLGKDRGMKAALTIAKAFSASDLKMIVAGKIDCQEAKALCDLNNVTYLGEISNAQALASYQCSDYVLTYYDPKYEINRLAESNKWGDAMCSNTGIIVNSEVTSAKIFLDMEDNISVPYNDLDGLITAIKVKIDNKNKPTNKAASSPLLFEEQLERLFSELAIKRTS